MRPLDTASEDLEVANCILESLQIQMRIKVVDVHAAALVALDSSITINSNHICVWDTTDNTTSNISSSTSSEGIGIGNTNINSRSTTIKDALDTLQLLSELSHVKYGFLAH